MYVPEEGLALLYQDLRGLAVLGIPQTTEPLLLEAGGAGEEEEFLVLSPKHGDAYRVLLAPPPPPLLRHHRGHQAHVTVAYVGLLCEQRLGLVVDYGEGPDYEGKVLQELGLALHLLTHCSGHLIVVSCSDQKLFGLCGVERRGGGGGGEMVCGHSKEWHNGAWHIGVQ